ncbi:MAG: hypothetical protein ACXVCY_02955 [Pseudobdellovibrionaceae bacterium]
MIKQIGFVVLAAMVFQAGAVRAEKGEFEKEIPDQSAPDCPMKVKFKVNTENPELNRAWLVAYYDKRSMQESDGPVPKAMDIMVPGLSYSPESKQIVFKKADGSKVICADNVSGGSLYSVDYTETGKCTINISKTKISQDNGFSIKKIDGAKITLNLHE